MEDQIAVKPRLFVSFSGGRSSGYMAHHLRSHYQDQYDLRFGFANTGQESDETLAFVHRCDGEWGLDLTWLEAEVQFGARKRSGHRVVTYQTASRSGAPYEDVIRKYGIPNKTHPHCTRELKVNPIRSYLRSLGWAPGSYLSAVGIRADEPKRLRAREDGIVYPLAHWFPTTKPEINDWWSLQHFDLNLADYRGNCVWCWKKSTTKLIRIAQETPQTFDFPARMEREYADAGTNSDPEHRRVFFRGHLPASSILRLAAAYRLPTRVADADEDSGCSESCEALV